MNNLQNLKFATKQLVFLLFYLVGIVALSLVAYSTLDNQKQQMDSLLGQRFRAYQAVSDTDSNIYQINALFSQSLLAISQGNSDQDWDQFKSFVTTKTDASTAALKSIQGFPSLSADEKKMVDQMLTTMETYQKAVLVGVAYTSNLPMFMSFKRNADTASQQITELGQQLMDAERQGMEKGQLAAQQAITTSLVQFFLILVVVVALLVFISVVVTKSITKPIRSLVQCSRTLAQGDFTVPITVVSKDEVGVLAESFQALKTSLVDVISQLRQTIVVVTNMDVILTENVASSNTGIKQVSQEAMLITDRMTAMDQEINTSLKNLQQLSVFFKETLGQLLSQQNAAINRSTSPVEHISRSIENLGNVTSSKLDLALRLKENASSGEEMMSETISEIQKVVKSTESILELLQVINSITSETNLLAMNAAIEAAHAGEYGKGFTVVADEIRKLSESTAVNSREISKTLNEIITYIHSAESTTAKTGETFEKIVAGVAEVGDSLLLINKAMTELSSESAEITDSHQAILKSADDFTKTMGTGTAQINGMVTSMDSISSISSVTKTSMSEMLSATESLFQSMQRLSIEQKNNDKNIKELNSLVGKFKVN